MRNIIYRYVLVEQSAIRCTANTELPTEPGLLRTCREIRHEASDIYFKEDFFLVHMENYEAGQLIRWSLKLGRHLRAHLKFRFHGLNAGSWSNLLVWLEAYNKGEAPGMALREHRSTHVTAVRMFEIVRKQTEKNVPWVEIASILEDIKVALGASGVAWI
ncbi:hypothetical protein CLAFUW4_14139 [Fulvia fulva]|nr:hypothetical protein CLAFUR4_14142 [Fulvia fulva]WPV22344.1 hypothetical protein CLAFUW4_14139 [Fulvia fulva]WPV37184.1 hypothetical protein CLAFUW7_14150 [Fulvia fulva]